MNKFKALILITFFAVSAIPGFLLGKLSSFSLYPFAQKALHNESIPVTGIDPGEINIDNTPKYTKTTKPLRPTETTFTLPEQERILIIFADDLNAPDSTLLSIWGLFISNSDHPSMIFKPLYPTPNQSNADNVLKNAFEITPSKKPSEKFLVELNSFEINWDGYVLTDKAFIDQFAIEMNQPNNLLETISSTDPELSMSSQKLFLKETCNVIQAGKEKSGLTIDWLGMDRSHIESDLDFNILSMGWGWILNSKTLTICEIIS